MASKYRDNHPTLRQRDDSAFRCGFAMPLPDMTICLTVIDRQSGRMVARTAQMERSQVRDELHRLRELFPLADGYDITASAREKERSQ